MEPEQITAEQIKTSSYGSRGHPRTLCRGIMESHGHLLVDVEQLDAFFM
jgi:hypothetical protein